MLCARTCALWLVAVFYREVQPFHDRGVLDEWIWREGGGAGMRRARDLSVDTCAGCVHEARVRDTCGGRVYGRV